MKAPQKDLLKEKCYLDRKSGIPIAKIQQKCKITKSTLYRWTHDYEREKNLTALSQSEQDIIRDYKRAKQTLTIYQEAMLSNNSPFPERVRAIQRLNG